jgi:hypothetical protein
MSLESSVYIRRTHPPAYRPFTPRRLSSTKFRSSFHAAASGRFQHIALKLWYGYPVAPQFSILRLPAFKNKNRYMKRRNPPYTVIADVYPGIAA